MRPPWFYRAVLNPLRRWLEDRRVPECAYIDQMKGWWAADDRARRPLARLTLVEHRRVGTRISVLQQRAARRRHA